MDNISEKEQLEQMRQWWSEYGNFVMGGIVVGVGIIVGLSQYRQYTVRTQTEASAVYETLFEAVAGGKLDEAEIAAGKLFADYDSTIYPSQARLALARLYMDKGRDQDAADALKVVVDTDADSQYAQVARLRLAKVYLYQNKPEAVVELLANIEEDAFTSRYSEVLGDAHVMLGNIDQARDAYLRAMADNASNPTVDRPLLQMKIDDLPEVVVATIDATEEIAPPEEAAGEDPAVEETEDATVDGEEESE